MKSDTQLRDDIQAEMEWEPTLNTARVVVQVKDGVATLAGSVGSYPEKWEAEKAAQRVAGVTALAIDLSVDVGPPREGGDAQIAHAATQVLRWMELDPNGAVKLLVEDGWIELSGELDRDHRRKAVVRALGHIAGVKGINDCMTLSPMVPLATVKSDIEAALKRRAVVQAHQISVSVDGSEVTLRGRVGSWAERAVAQHSAWGTAGVRSVVDNIIVVT